MARLVPSLTPRVERPLPNVSVGEQVGFAGSLGHVISVEGAFARVMFEDEHTVLRLGLRMLARATTIAQTIAG
jgi:hypothetical protein